MIRYYLFSLVFLASTLFVANANGQSFTHQCEMAEKSQPPTAISITYNKTSTIIFNGTVIHVDRGSNVILVQKIKGTENVIKLKAATANFPETNLSVITSDGLLFSFIVSYDSSPASLVVYADKISSHQLNVDSNKNVGIYGKGPINFSIIKPDVFQEEQLNEAVVKAGKNTRGIKSHHLNMRGVINGIYIKNNILFFRLEIFNRSNIGYDISQIRVYIRDKKKVRRTAMQDVEINPLWTNIAEPTVDGMQSKSFVFAIEKFTIPDAKWLVFEATEKNGGRHLNMKLSNKKIVKAGLLEK
jgi:conjugative transposon TraN protein